MMMDQCLPTSAATQDQSAIDAIINQIEETNLVEGDTIDGLHSPTVGMTQAPIITRLHSPIIKLNRSMEITSSGKEGDVTLPKQQAPETVDEYLQTYHPEYNSHPTDANV